ncbi:MAG: MetQ/NlpA family ABC transporter substrate-binding protein [Clostridia bacterium]|nr:MetQ/NlpA family ABC transporter substrate-binding protein [Clostridia bacterium]
MKRIIALTLAAVMLVLCLASCGGKNPADTTADSNGEKTENVTLTVAASSTPHAEILEECKSALAEKNITLDIKVMDDYVIPNNSTESGDVDANYFQHKPYLDQFNEENGTHLVSVAKVHYEPLGIYAGTASSLDALEDGAKIAVPNDATNEARALQLLAAQGLITLKADAGLTATKNDITENPKNLDIVEIEASLIPGMLDEVAVAVINGNYAIGAGLKGSEALAVEDKDSEAAQTFANILVVKEGNENNEAVLALVEALRSETVQNFIADKYDGAVVPMAD